MYIHTCVYVSGKKSGRVGWYSMSVVYALVNVQLYAASV